jgi:hypothetical protein
MENKYSVNFSEIICTPVSIKNIQQLFSPEVSSATASRYINEARDGIGKEKHQILSIIEFKKYFGLE